MQAVLTTIGVLMFVVLVAVLVAGVYVMVRHSRVELWNMGVKTDGGFGDGLGESPRPEPRNPAAKAWRRRACTDIRRSRHALGLDAPTDAQLDAMHSIELGLVQRRLWEMEMERGLYAGVVA